MAEEKRDMKGEPRVVTVHIPDTPFSKKFVEIMYCAAFKGREITIGTLKAL